MEFFGADYGLSRAATASILTQRDFPIVGQAPNHSRKRTKACKAQRFYAGWTPQQVLRGASQLIPYMIVRKPSVDLVHTFPLREYFIPDIHLSSLESPLFTFQLSSFQLYMTLTGGCLTPVFGSHKLKRFSIPKFIRGGLG